MSRFLKRIICTGLFLISGFSLLAQNNTPMIQIDETAYEKAFVIKPAISVSYSSPQKYGIQGEVYFGNRYEEVSDSSYKIPHRHIFLKSVSLEGSYNRGGYNFGITYSRLSAYIGTVGIKYGLFYYSNNNHSFVKKTQKLAGPELTLHIATFELKTGILKELNGKSFIPIIGFGFRLGPNLYN